ncbi:MAG: polysaccharide deacetylase family protein [Clostridia bacterium]|nr:polysaccharide deacetylase family protein [Clostridia bacterium]
MNKKSWKFSHTATNLALGALILSVGFACLLPIERSVTTDGAEANVYRSAGSDTGAVSLMFNVYWGTEEVERILEILSSHEATATFFIGGCWADDNVECLKKIFEAGHELGNHGYFHKDHKTLGREANRKEIETCNEFVRLSTGITPVLFAPPSGSYGKTALEVAETLGMKTILWSRDTIDWRDKDSALIYKRATKDIQGGEFVLMHPMKETADALDDILKYYASQNLKAVSVSENLKGKG